MICNETVVALRTWLLAHPLAALICMGFKSHKSESEPCKPRPAVELHNGIT